MNIKELISEQQTEEGIGSALATGARGLAKGTGAALGGLAGMGSAFKQGYQGGKLAVAGGPAPANTTAPATAGAPAAGGGADPTNIRQQIAQKKAEIADLQKQLGAPKVEPGIGQQQGQVAAVASNTPEPTAPAQPAATEPEAVAQPTPADIRKQKQAAAAQAAQDQMAANPAPTAPATPPIQPGIGQQQGKVNAVASNTPDPKAQQAALKARLQGQRAAGKSMATQTGSGFNQYVQGGGGQKLAGADAQGNPVFKQNVQRESVGYSKFLGCYI
jgi:hypothetical protein